MAAVAEGNAIIARAQEIAHWVAVEANVRIRMMRAGSTSMASMEQLEQELHHAQMQLRLMRANPRYQGIPDPTTVNPSHVACEAEADALRTKNLRLKVQVDKLWADAAHLKSQLREHKPTRYPLTKVKRGRPPGANKVRVSELAAEIEQLTGYPLRKANFSTTYYLTRGAMEAIVRMLREADDCRTLHQGIAS